MSRSRHTMGAAVLCIGALLLAAPSASAMRGGSSFAKASEAPWAVHLNLPGGGHCTGSVVKPGVILTAWHCLAATTCQDAPVATVKIRFATRSLIVRNAPTRIVRHPNFSWPGCAGMPVYDMAILRYKTIRNEPGVPLASAAEVESLKGKGVTLFGAGWTPTGNPPRNVFPKWVRKSNDHKWQLTPFCQTAASLCFLSTGTARVTGGDSGGPWVGWFGGWKQMSVVSGYLTQGEGPVLQTGVSLVDPTARAWLDQQLAAG